MSALNLRRMKCPHLLDEIKDKKLGTTCYRVGKTGCLFLYWQEIWNIFSAFYHARVFKKKNFSKNTCTSSEDRDWNTQLRNNKTAGYTGINFPFPFWYARHPNQLKPFSSNYFLCSIFFSNLSILKISIFCKTNLAIYLERNVFRYFIVWYAFVSKIVTSNHFEKKNEISFKEKHRLFL